MRPVEAAARMADSLMDDRLIAILMDSSFGLIVKVGE
jgi:hypothetical protein